MNHSGRWARLMYYTERAAKREMCHLSFRQPRVGNRRPVQTWHSHPDVWLEDGVNVEHVGRQLVKSVTSM